MPLTSSSCLSRLFPWAPWLPLLLAAPLLLWSGSRELSAGIVVLAYLAFCLLVWRGRPAAAEVVAADHECLIAYASQGGQAQRLAELSAQQLKVAGIASSVLPLNALTPASLGGLSRLLLIVSTYGDGEAPDNGAAFERSLLREAPNLARLDYAMLALGDSTYRHFCGFARRLDARLRMLGARALHDRLEADRLDPASLRHWQQQLGQLTGHAPFSDWQPAEWEAWRLTQRQRLNPGSQGGPVFHLHLVPESGEFDWQAGDIAELGPCHPPGRIAALLDTLNLDGEARQADGHTLAWHLARRQLPEGPVPATSAEALLDSLAPLPHREYSIASTAADGALELVVRQMHHPDGRPGLGSGWLCLHAPLGARIDLRIRANPGFRLERACGPLILIGNGTGIAGLRAHLRSRDRLSQHGHWLLFGERNAGHDRLFREELEAWADSGHLSRLDLLFSRDGDEQRYVQHRLRDRADELRERIAQGACLLVCGSLDGMGREVDAVLRGILGAALVDELAREGRYRRDLY
ncbi:sulfite reductase subunit alpha [Stutzerimonas tarimensis]|uniref:NADPH--hemoprotein reductase n=1 Tax=Stutzerimonas tarimensis TaxID=1507735 RepID=A0ABV7T8Q6_9GAMM